MKFICNISETELDNYTKYVSCEYSYQTLKKIYRDTEPDNAEKIEQVERSRQINNHKINLWWESIFRRYQIVNDQNTRYGVDFEKRGIYVMDKGAACNECD